MRSSSCLAPFHCLPNRTVTMFAFVSGGERKKLVKKMFRLMDENSSGSVNEAEAIPMLKMVLGSPEAAQLYWKEMIEKCDKDKNSKIDEKGQASVPTRAAVVEGAVALLSVL